MPGPARAGVLLYAKQLDRLSVFYQRLLGMTVLDANDERQIIANADMQLVLLAMPSHAAAAIDIAVPPVPREQTVKAFFSVPDLAVAIATASALGGGAFDVEYAGPGFRARNVFDPEGNIMQLRAFG